MQNISRHNKEVLLNAISCRTYSINAMFLLLFSLVAVIGDYLLALCAHDEWASISVKECLHDTGLHTLNIFC